MSRITADAILCMLPARCYPCGRVSVMFGEASPVTRFPEGQMSGCTMGIEHYGAP